VHLFKTKQSQKAVMYNIRVINSLINYLVEADYIYKNPLKLIKKIAKFISPDSQTLEIKARILEDNEFKAVLDVLEELPELSSKERDFKAKAKLIFSLLYHLGLRVNELSCARWDNFKLVQGRVWFFLIGKGGKPGQIPVNNELLDIIMQFRKYHQKVGEINGFEQEYILPSSKTERNLSARRIREIVKEIFGLAAAKFTDANVQAKLRNAYPHDLRHLLASNLDTLGLSIIDSKEILRHSSEKTTEIYRNSKEAKRHAAIQGNVTGMNNLLSYTEANYTEFKFSIACRKQDILSFNYFINAVVSLHLKRYTIINGINLEEIKKKFMQQATMFDDLTIRFLLEDNLDEKETDYLQKTIMHAGYIRGIKVKFF
jgi:integrase/recombinase XerC